MPKPCKGFWGWLALAGGLILVDQLTKRIVNKLLHPTMVSLRDAVQDESSLSQRVALLRTLFDLSDTTEEDLP